MCYNGELSIIIIPTVTLSGSGDHMFRGFLVQARSVADGSPVGVFTDNGEDQTPSSCSPPEVCMYTFYSIPYTYTFLKIA